MFSYHFKDPDIFGPVLSGFKIRWRRRGDNPDKLGRLLSGFPSGDTKPPVRVGLAMGRYTPPQTARRARHENARAKCNR